MGGGDAWKTVDTCLLDPKMLAGLCDNMYPKETKFKKVGHILHDFGPCVTFKRWTFSALNNNIFKKKCSDPTWLYTSKNVCQTNF